MAKPITTPIVADLPENWTNGQTIAASGADVGLSKQHGFNYLNKKVNEALSGLDVLNTFLEKVYTKNDKPTAIDIGILNAEYLNKLSDNYINDLIDRKINDIGRAENGVY